MDREFNTWAIKCKLPEDQEISVGYGIIGKMYSFELTMIQKRIDGIMVMDNVEVLTRYRKFFWKSYQRNTRRYIDYETINPLEE